jgi:SAM-dependent methyltransferase
MAPRWLAGVLLCSAAFGQKAEFDFFPEFRNVFTVKVRADNPAVMDQEILEKYASSLKADGVTNSEIARRTQLLRSERRALESDYWNRYYSDPQSKFNTAPNAFLMEMVTGRTPGTALDYAMGTGRNSIYLAQQGWTVWGFDPADAGVALAQKRAGELGLTLNAVAAWDSEYEFGKDRFDLILFSWAMPFVPVERIVDALKPGGMVVMEAAVDYVGRNGMLKMFDALKIVRYEIVRTKADFYDRREIEVLRMVAIKP